MQHKWYTAHITLSETLSYAEQHKVVNDCTEFNCKTLKLFVNKIKHASYLPGGISCNYDEDFELNSVYDDINCIMCPAITLIYPYNKVKKIYLFRGKIINDVHEFLTE